MFIILDNAESILDPQGTDAQEIYATVEELSQFNNLCLCITSHISTIPPDCETLAIPTLSMEAAHNAFYHIYKHGKQSNLTNNILEQLDFHPLSITLLATVAHHCMWDTDQLAMEWDQHHTGLLQTEHNKSLAATIELLLSSPMFQELGPDAHDLLGVIAFLPQGIDKNNLDWLFPTISNRKYIFDKFCILSLTYKSNGFITMLAPLQDYLCPKDPMSSPLLCKTKDQYFYRLSVNVYPGQPGFEKAQWITLEDVNVEHLLNVFTTIDATSDNVWDACYHFMEHLHCHKPRPVILGPKIEELPDDHTSKPQCLLQFSVLFASVGNWVERKWLLTHTLNLWKKWGHHYHAAHTLVLLSCANFQLYLDREGIAQAKEALGIFEQFNDRQGQAKSLRQLAQLLHKDNQLTAAEEALTKAINLSLSGGDQYLVCQCHFLLGDISHSKGEVEMAIDHYQVALTIATSLSWHDHEFWIHCRLAGLFSSQHRFNEAYAHIELAKPHAKRPSLLGNVMVQQAGILYTQHRLEEAKSDALCAVNIFEEIGAIQDLGRCRWLLQQIEQLDC